MLYAFVFAALLETPDYLVVGVTDGDTITVREGDHTFRVRLRGIDAPEPGQPFEVDARVRLKQLVGGRIVKLELHGRDRDNRVLADVFVGGSWVNGRMVREGYAWYCSQFSKNDTLQQWHQEARSKKRGLWEGRCPIPPWEAYKYDWES